MACGAYAGNCVFLLFSSATSRSSEIFFIAKIYIGKKASFHSIVTVGKNTKMQVTRVFKEESQDMDIFEVAFDMT